MPIRKSITGESLPTFEMETIGKRLLTQNNRITQDPIFLVQEKKREWGVDPGYTDLFTWIHDEDCDQVSPQKMRALEKKFDETGDDNPKGYRRVGYTERWEYVQACFTEAAAQLYIDENRHNLHEPRIYAASGYRNKEWIAVRAYLKSLAPTGGAR